MNIIKAQEQASKKAFSLKPKNIYEAFELYEMLIEDYYYRQYELINKEIKDYIDKNFVDVKDLDIGDKNVFYVSSKFENKEN